MFVTFSHATSTGQHLLYWMVTITNYSNNSFRSAIEWPLGKTIVHRRYLDILNNSTRFALKSIPEFWMSEYSTEQWATSNEHPHQSQRKLSWNNYDNWNLMFTEHSSLHWCVCVCVCVCAFVIWDRLDLWSGWIVDIPTLCDIEAFDTFIVTGFYVWINPRKKNIDWWNQMKIKDRLRSTISSRRCHCRWTGSWSIEYRNPFDHIRSDVITDNFVSLCFLSP